jgi:hypothetical protein
MKTIADLTKSELIELAGEAWSEAARSALAAGHPVTGSRDGRRIRYYPDGHIEDLGPTSELPPDDNEASQEEISGRSVA